MTTTFKSFKLKRYLSKDEYTEKFGTTFGIRIMSHLTEELCANCNKTMSEHICNACPPKPDDSYRNDFMMGL